MNIHCLHNLDLERVPFQNETSRFTPWQPQQQKSLAFSHVSFIFVPSILLKSIQRKVIRFIYNSAFAVKISAHRPVSTDIFMYTVQTNLRI